ncbi:MAG: tape measure protein, partial [Burkholderiaceae bacterium]
MAAANDLRIAMRIDGDNRPAVVSLQGFETAVKAAQSSIKGLSSAQIAANQQAQQTAAAQQRSGQALGELNSVYRGLRAEIGGPLVAAQQRYQDRLVQLQSIEARLTAEARNSVLVQGQLRQARNDATEALNRETAAANKAQQSGGVLSGVYGNLRGAVLGLGAAFGASQLVSTADQYTVLSGQLKLVTGNAQELASAQQGLLQISNDNGSAIGANASLYARLARATEDAGLGQNKLLTIV